MASSGHTRPGALVVAFAGVVGIEDAQLPLQTGMLAYLKRTTVKIPDALDARLRHEAERRGTTIAEISREALEAYFGAPSMPRRLSAAGSGHSGRSDVSERIEEILAAEVAR